MTRIGVAIPVPEPWAAQLQRHRVSFGDPQATAIPTHLTLVPPTDVCGDLADVHAHLERVAARHAPFRLTLRGTATFRPVSPVVFVAVAEGISSCELLASAARSGPLAQQLSFPYHPHVTVAHDVPDEALDTAFETLADFGCSFTVDAFWLYTHCDGVWHPARAHALTGQVVQDDPAHGSKDS